MREERRFDGTNSRLRPGIAPCPEVLVDLPRNVTAFDGFGASGFTNLAPAVKRQISPIPEKFDARSTAGPRCAALLAVPVVRGDRLLVGEASHLFKSGGGYHITNTQQIDFHIGFGLNRNAPTYIFGVGYSFRSMDRIEGCALARRRIERFRSGQMLRAFVQYALPARYGA